MKKFFIFLIIASILICSCSSKSTHKQLPIQEKNDFSFVVLGDSRPAYPGEEQPFIHQKILKRINEIKPAFVVNTGDVILGYNDDRMFKEYDDFKKLMSKLNVPYYIAPGNHDIFSDKSDSLYRKVIGEPYFSFNYKDSHFIILNTEERENISRIAGRQLEWLKEDLARTGDKGTLFVFSHRPMYPVSRHKGNSLDRHPSERDSLHSLFKRYKVDVVFNGHEHLYAETEKDSIYYIITGGAGAPLYESEESKGGFEHFIIVTVSGNNVKRELVRERNYLREGDKYLFDGDYDSALKSYNTILSEFPDYSEVWYRFGLVYIKKGLIDTANYCIQKYIALKDSSAEAYNIIGQYMMNLKLYNEAKPHITKYIELKPNEAYPHSVLAEIYLNTNKPDSALISSKKALEIDSNFAWAYFIMGLAYKDKGEKQTAIEMFETYIKMRPNAVNAKKAKEYIEELKKQ